MYRTVNFSLKNLKDLLPLVENVFILVLLQNYLRVRKLGNL